MSLSILLSYVNMRMDLGFENIHSINLAPSVLFEPFRFYIPEN